LRRAGYETAELDVLRKTYERYLRGELNHDEAQTVVDRAATRPWFDLAWVPRHLPEAGSWPDIHFDPHEVIARRAVSRPPLLSAVDEWGSDRPERHSLATRRTTDGRQIVRHNPRAIARSALRA
jgi:hypothetical protein